MPDIDDRIRSGLAQLSRPADANGAFDRVVGKKHRRRVVRRAQNALLSVGTLALAAGGIVGLVHAFRGGAPPSQVASSVANGRIAFDVGRGLNVEIDTVEPDGSGVTKLVDGRDPAWSPDGTRIAYRTGIPQRHAADVHIMVANADGAKAHSIFTMQTEPGTAGPPSWSPDGTRLAFASIDGIYVVGAGGEDPHRISSYPGDRACYDLATTWSPDGSTIAFAVRCDGSEQGIWAVQADGSDRRQVLAPSASIEAMAYPSFSPNGMQIAFAGAPPPNDGHGAIYVMNADGSDVRKLVDGALWASSLAWSPDGTRLAFTKTAGGLVTVNLGGTDPQRVVDEGESPAWQPVPASSATPTEQLPVTTTPTAGAASDQVLLKEIGPTCDTSKVTDDFDGDGLDDVAVVYFAPPAGGDCSVPPEKRNYELFVSWSSGGSTRVDLSDSCANTDACRAFAAPDLDLDGKAELAIEHAAGASTAVLDFWAFRPDARVMVEEGGPEHVAGIQPLALVWGAAATHMDRIECVAGVVPSVVAVSSQLDEVANTWEVDESVFKFDGASQVVLESTTHRSVPVGDPAVRQLEPGDGICGASIQGDPLQS
jgi:WD40 repeat protein